MAIKKLTAHPSLFLLVLSLVDVNSHDGGLMQDMLLKQKSFSRKAFFQGKSSFHQFLVKLVKVGQLDGGNPRVQVLFHHLSLDGDLRQINRYRV